MRKFVALLLATVLFLGTGVLGCFPVSAAEVNLCETFGELSWFCNFYGQYPLSVFSIVNMVQLKLHRMPGSYVEEENWDMVVSKEVFMDVLEKNFVLTTPFEQMLAEDETSTKIIIADGDNYVIPYRGGYGSPSGYAVVGYTENGDGTYNVFFRLFGGDFSSDPESYQGVLDEVKWATGATTDEEAAEKLYIHNGYYRFWYEPAHYRTLTVSYDGANLRIMDGGDVASVPADMVTPNVTGETIFTKVPEGMTVSGDSFPEKTCVRVEEVAEGEAFERAEKALAEIAEKTVVYEFSAFLGDTPIQPNGKVCVTFAIPEELSTENLSLFYIAQDGTREEIALTVNAEARTAAAELAHFSTYVLANVKGAAKAPPTGDTALDLVLCGFVMLTCAAVGAATVMGKKKQH